MNLQTILNEIQYKMYQTYVYVEFDDSTNITDIAQIIRSMKYVAVVNNKTNKEDLKPRGLLLVKAVTTKPGEETFELIKKESLGTIPELKKFVYSVKRLEKVEDL